MNLKWNNTHLRDSTLEHELKDALANGELLVYYQPLICCSSGRVTGAEALIRWQHPVRGLLLPKDFLSVAEESGLINDIGWYVLNQAAQDGAAFARNGMAIDISVNVSALQFEQTDFIDRILSALKQTGLPPKLLELELTESVLMKDPELAGMRLQRLRTEGVRLAIDDFGTGYSSLSYLSRLPIDTIKIDRSFIPKSGTHDRRNALVTIIMHMAKSLNLRCVAEGIESMDDLEFIRGHGVEVAQGYLFSPALPLPAFSGFLTAFHSWPSRTKNDTDMAASNNNGYREGYVSSDIS